MLPPSLAPACILSSHAYQPTTHPPQGFDDCTAVAATFKLLDSFEGLLDRDAIARDLERKHLDLVRHAVLSWWRRGRGWARRCV